MSRSHPQQWVIVEAIERPPAAVVTALAGFPTTQIADCGGPVGVVGPGLGRIAGGAEFCGPAVTVWTKPGDILFMLKLPEVTRPGDVVAVDGGGREDAAVLGDILAGAVARKGVVGIVVDGAVRDIEGIDEIGVPTLPVTPTPPRGPTRGRARSTSRCRSVGSRCIPVTWSAGTPAVSSWCHVNTSTPSSR